MRPVSSLSSSPSTLNFQAPLIIGGIILLLAVGVIVWLGSSTPVAEQIAYEKTIDVAR